MDQGEVRPTANAEAPQPNSQGESHESQETAEAIVRRDTHLRVLKESQKYKQPAVEAETKLKTFEETMLAEQQQYKELAEHYRSELNEVKTAKTELQLRTQLLPELAKHGCRDATDALQLGDRKLLMHDPDSESLIGVEEFVKDLQQRKPWLFDNGKPSSINPSLTSVGKVPIGGKEDLSSLTKDEIKARLKSLG